MQLDLSLVSGRRTLLLPQWCSFFHVAFSAVQFNVGNGVYNSHLLLCTRTNEWNTKWRTKLNIMSNICIFGFKSGKQWTNNRKWIQVRAEILSVIETFKIISFGKVWPEETIGSACLSMSNRARQKDQGRDEDVLKLRAKLLAQGSSTSLIFFWQWSRTLPFAFKHRQRFCCFVVLFPSPSETTAIFPLPIKCTRLGPSYSVGRGRVELNRPLDFLIWDINRST